MISQRPLRTEYTVPVFHGLPYRVGIPSLVSLAESAE